MGNANTDEWAWFAPDAPILMTDWRHKRIADVVIGDDVVGFTSGTIRDRAKLLRSSVVAVHAKVVPMVELRMASGRHILTTKSAAWFTNRKPTTSEPYRKPYAPARVGGHLMVADLVEDEPSARHRMLWYYLAGMVDGEGHIAESALPITQTTGKNGPVWERLCEVLDTLGISYNAKYHRPETMRDGWQPKADAVIRNVRDVYRRLLRYSEPAKARQMIDALWHRPSRPVRSRDKVVEIRQVGEREAFAIETASGNHIADGYAASNRAQEARCPAGHAVTFRSDGLGKVYRSCTCTREDRARQVAEALDLQRSQIAGYVSGPTGERADRDVIRRAEPLIARAAKLRQSQGLSQRAVADMLNISGTNVSNWETGYRPPRGPIGATYARLLLAWAEEDLDRQTAA